MVEKIKQKQRPFHEAIVAAINRVRGKSGLKLRAKDIIATKVPTNHDEIIEALRRRAIALNAGEMLALKCAISVLKKQKAEAIEKSKGNPKNFLFPGPFMEKGSTGRGVSVLQLFMKKWNNKIKVDGIFGDETEAGIKAFQYAMEIEEDGKFGPNTRNALLRETGVDINLLKADIFNKETVAVPPEPWADIPIL